MSNQELVERFRQAFANHDEEEARRFTESLPEIPDDDDVCIAISIYRLPPQPPAPPTAEQH